MIPGKRPFTDSSEKPGKDELRQVLETTFPFYEEIKELSKDFKHDWNFSKNSGWMQKVHDGKKVLYYFIALFGAFKVSLAMHGKERDAFLKEKAFVSLHSQIEAAKKYVEGYALQFSLDDENSFSVLRDFLVKLIELRR